MTEETDRFEARSTSGRVHTVIELQHVIERRLLSGQTHQVRGSTEYILSDGRQLEPRPDGTFVIVQTEEVLTQI